ncbi:MAG: HAD-IA family hydrolase [Novosphingobium sp.]
MRTRLAVFDCDGTLVDGQASICNAMDRAFADQGLSPPDRSRVRRIVGLSLPQAVRRLIPDHDEALHLAIAESYKQAFRAARASGELSEPLFDGIADTVQALRRAGWTLGVATGKSDRGLEHCLAMHGLTASFETLQTADRHPSKPHPAMLQAALDEVLADCGDAVMIGDTDFDMAMARSAGVRAIGVAWGYHDVPELTAAGAEFVAETPAELTEYLLR